MTCGRMPSTPDAADRSAPRGSSRSPRPRAPRSACAGTLASGRAGAAAGCTRRGDLGGADVVADRLERALELDPPGVKDSASPKLKALRSELATARRRRQRPAALARLRSRPAAASAGGLRHRARRAAVVAVRASARGAVPGIVHDTEQLRPDAVRGAVRDRRAVEPPARARRRRARRGRAHPGRALTPRRALRRRARRRRRGARPRSTSRSPRARSRAAGAAARSSPPTTSSSSPRATAARPGDRRADRHRRSPAYACSCSAAPNTGGKTVALKTVGLCALLPSAACTCRPSARGCSSSATSSPTSATSSRSQQSLSTFSGHMRQHRADPDAATPQHARAARRAGRRHRPDRGRRAGAGAARRARRSAPR